MAVGQLLLDADDFVTAIPAAKRLKLLNYVAAAVVGIHVRDGARAPRARAAGTAALVARARMPARR